MNEFAKGYFYFKMTAGLSGVLIVGVEQDAEAEPITITGMRAGYQVESRGEKTEMSCEWDATTQEGRIALPCAEWRYALYDVFVQTAEGQELKLLEGEIGVDERITPPLPGAVEEFSVGAVLPKASGGAVKVYAMRGPRGPEGPMGELTTEDREYLEGVREDAEAAAEAAEAALANMPQTDAGGNMVLPGGLTVGGVVNANGGVNVPVAPDSDTSVTRRCDFSYPVSMFARGCAPNSIAFYIRAGVNLGAPGYYAKKGAPLFLTEMRSFDNADSNYYAWHTYTQAVDIPTKRGNSVNVCYNNKEGYSPRPRFNFGLSRIMPNESLNSVNESSFIYPIFSEGSASEASNAIASYWPFNMAADRKDRVGFQQASPVLSASTLKSFLYAQLPSSAVRLIYWRKHNGGKKTNCFLFTQSLSGEVMLIGSVDLIYNYNAGALFLSGFYTAGVQDNWAMHDIDVFGCDAIVNANGIAFTSPNWPIEQSLFIPPADGGDCVVVLTCADKSYTLLDYPEWVTVSEGAGELNVSVAANESGTEREGFINLTLFNGITYSVLIHQGA